MRAARCSASAAALQAVRANDALRRERMAADVSTRTRAVGGESGVSNDAVKLASRRQRARLPRRLRLSNEPRNRPSASAGARADQYAGQAEVRPGQLAKARPVGTSPRP